ncbi:MAG: hypothetical protein GY828_04100 [Candidatus Gracilibacteria bacterium]|nr:hypothetical protein [Candidatus Gracilibacteria bacterium]
MLGKIKTKIQPLLGKKKGKKEIKENTTSHVCMRNIDKKKYKSKRSKIQINLNNLIYLQKISKYKKKIFFTILSFFLCVFIFFVYGPVFTIDKIYIYRNDSISNINLSYTSIKTIRGKGIIHVDDSEIYELIQNDQNNIRDIDINYSLPDTVKIHLSSYPILFSTYINEKHYFITQNGTLVPGKEKDGTREIKIQETIDSFEFNDYKQIYRQDQLKEIYDSIHFFEENIIDTSIVDIYYYPIEKEVHFQLESGALLLLTFATSLNDQIKKSAIYNTEYRALSHPDIVYLDLRIKNKIFFCDVEQEVQCKRNLKRIYK